MIRRPHGAKEKGIHMAKQQKYCPNCGTVAVPKKYMKGTFVTELLLWLFFLLPGLIYSIYRLSSKYEGCPACEFKEVVPLSSPVARAALASQ